jgi:Virulence factor BrkB
MRASNAIYDVGEGRPIYKTLPTRVATTVVLLLLLAISAIAVVLTGGLAQQVGKFIGIGQTAVQVWDIAKWPVLVLVIGLMFSILYWAAPNVKHPGFRWLTPGGLLAVLVWIVASLLFAFYVANFSSYNKTYGALGSVIVFPDLAVDLQHRDPARRRGQRRARARAADRGRPPGRQGAVRRAARHQEAQGLRGEAVVKLGPQLGPGGTL